jgi:hypothetical protein
MRFTQTTEHVCLFSRNTSFCSERRKLPDPMLCLSEFSPAFRGRNKEGAYWAPSPFALILTPLQIDIEEFMFM